MSKLFEDYGGEYDYDFIENPLSLPDEALGLLSVALLRWPRCNIASLVLAGRACQWDQDKVYELLFSDHHRDPVHWLLPLLDRIEKLERQLDELRSEP